jgi:hypothetical protein
LDKFQATYEVIGETQHTIKFAQRMPKSVPVRLSLLGYIYVRKHLWRELREPETIRLTVVPVLPEDAPLVPDSETLVMCWYCVSRLMFSIPTGTLIRIIDKKECKHENRKEGGKSL